LRSNYLNPLTRQQKPLTHPRVSFPHRSRASPTGTEYQKMPPQPAPPTGAERHAPNHLNLPTQPAPPASPGVAIPAAQSQIGTWAVVSTTTVCSPSPRWIDSTVHVPTINSARGWPHHPGFARLPLAPVHFPFRRPDLAAVRKSVNALSET